MSRSLGRFWNTKIIILPGADVVRKGPYHLIRHPNYVIVTTELLVLPLLFGAYVQQSFLFFKYMDVVYPDSKRRKSAEGSDGLSGAIFIERIGIFVGWIVQIIKPKKLLPYLKGAEAFLCPTNTCYSLDVVSCCKSMFSRKSKQHRQNW